MLEEGRRFSGQPEEWPGVEKSSAPEKFSDLFKVTESLRQS